MSVLIATLKKRRNELRTELTVVERQIFDLETTYLEETREFGSVLSGWKNLTDNDKIKIKKVVANEEKLFSLSSVTSPASRNEMRKLLVGDKRAKKNNSGGDEHTEAGDGTVGELENDEERDGELLDEDGGAEDAAI